MHWRVLPIAASILAVAACTDPSAGRGAHADFREVFAANRIYRIDESMTGRIPHRVADAVNGVRQLRGLAPVELSPHLIAAARTHARDISVQNRPWHFGSDGSSPFERAEQARFDGVLIGENIAESYENELLILSAWLEREDTRSNLLDPQATRIGFGWHQQPNGKIWWVLLSGT